MEYEIILNIKIDPSCNYLEVDDIESSRVVLALVQDMLHEIDDLIVDKIEVTRLDQGESNDHSRRHESVSKL